MLQHNCFPLAHSRIRKKYRRDLPLEVWKPASFCAYHCASLLGFFQPLLDFLRELDRSPSTQTIPVLVLEARKLNASALQNASVKRWLLPYVPKF